MKTLLILRPEPGASETRARAELLGLETRSVPLFEIEALPWKAPDPSNFDALMLTSANAVRYGGAELQKLLSLPVYAVGEKTSDAARQAGFSVQVSGEGDGCALIKQLPSGHRLLHLAGENRRPLPAARVIPVYASRETRNPQLGDLRDTVVAVHSSRAGQRLAGLVRDRSRTAIVAISRPVAEACGEDWLSCSSAPVPSDEALLALAVRLCENRAP